MKKKPTYQKKSSLHNRTVRDGKNSKEPEAGSENKNKLKVEHSVYVWPDKRRTHPPDGPGGSYDGL